MVAIFAPDQRVTATKPADLGDGITAWIDAHGRLQFALDARAEYNAYLRQRARMARKSLKAEFEEGGEPFGSSHVRVRVNLFERCIAGSHCPPAWKPYVDRLARMKEELFDRHAEAQRRAKAWYAQQLAALAAD